MTRVDRRWYQHVNDIRTRSWDDSAFLDSEGVTLTTAVADNDSVGLTVSSEATSASGWSADVTADAAGEYVFDLVLTTSDGQVRRKHFEVNVGE